MVGKNIPSVDRKILMSHQFNGYTTHSRSDGTFLGDAWAGDAWAGYNYTEEQKSMDGMPPRNEYVDMSENIHIDRLGYVCNRSMTREQRAVLYHLDEAMQVLFERMKAHTDEEIEMCDIENYGSRVYRAMHDVPCLHREIHFYGYSRDGFLEELYSKLSALYAYVIKSRRKHSITERSPIQLFGYYELVKTCMEFCRHAIIHTEIENDIKNPYCETGSDEYDYNPP
jgi:hypothetical protein